MKRHFLFLSLFTICTLAHAQGFLYTLSTTTAPYNDLVSPNEGSGTLIWDDPEIAIPLGFDFTVFDETVNTLYVDDIGPGGMLSTTADVTGNTQLIVPLYSDIIDKGNVTGTSESPISYLTEGTAPNRIAKIEWKNCGYYNEANDFGTANYTINFQVWLYETTNTIEFHYGPNNITDVDSVGQYLNGGTAFGPFLGLAYNFSFSTGMPEVSGYLTGDATNPTLQLLPPSGLDTVSTFLATNPLEGRVYIFNSLFVGNEKPVAETKFSVFPSPTDGILNLTVSSGFTGDYTWTVMDLLGNSILSGTDFESRKIDISNVPAGIYLVNMKSEASEKTFRIVRM